MRPRNHIARAVLLLALALGVGMAVAIFSGNARGRGIERSNLPAIEDRADQRTTRSSPWFVPPPACSRHEGCARL